MLSHKHVPSLFRAALCQREPDSGNAVPPVKGRGGRASWDVRERPNLLPVRAENGQGSAAFLL